MYNKFLTVPLIVQNLLDQSHRLNSSYLNKFLASFCALPVYDLWGYCDPSFQQDLGLLYLPLKEEQEAPMDF